jgi:hypothetical protein
MHFTSPWNPHINNFFPVVKASRIANQVMKACLGIEKGNQTNDHQSTIFSLTRMEFQVSDQENIPVKLA